MTGIEILAEYTAGGVTADVTIVMWAVTVVGLVVMWCGVFAENETAAVAGGAMVLLFFAALIAVEVIAEPEHTRYKVAISDDVKLVEFMERYEILDTEGEIYTIREVIPDA